MMAAELSKGSHNAHNLVVAYSDGREDVYPMKEGQSTLGSDSECEFGIQASGVEPRHVVFSVSVNSIFAINLCDSATARLNGAPLDGRRPFEVGDELAIGSVCIRLRRVSEDGEDLASSPDGIVEVAESIRRDHRFGWRGYRKILEKVAPFIAPEEAEIADRLHTTGRRMMGKCVITVIAIYGLSWIFQGNHWFVAEQVASNIAGLVSTFAILFLTARYRIRFAGRVLFLIESLIWGAAPPTETWTEYFGNQGWALVLFIAPILFLLGWLYGKRGQTPLIRRMARQEVADSTYLGAWQGRARLRMRRGREGRACRG